LFEMISFSMNWKKWHSWKGKYLLVFVLFALAYALTIPIRDYGFLGCIELTVWTHVAIILIGGLFLVELLRLIDWFVGHRLEKKI